MDTSLAYLALVLIASITFGSVGIAAFIIGVRYGTKQQGKVKTDVKIVEVAKPFVVTKETVREVSAPGFIYPKSGTPDVAQDKADKKFAELALEPEL